MYQIHTILLILLNSLNITEFLIRGINKGTSRLSYRLILLLNTILYLKAMVQNQSNIGMSLSIKLDK